MTRFEYTEIARFDRPFLANGKQATRVDADPEYFNQLQGLIDQYPDAIVTGSVLSQVIVQAMLKVRIAA